MLAEKQELSQEGLYRTEGSFPRQKYSVTTTQIQSNYEKSTTRICDNKYDSQPTLPELPYSSRAFDFEQTQAHTPLEHQVNNLLQRFSGIHLMLINHSLFESSLHQKKRGFKIMPIDQIELIPSYSNKANIISDIVELVEELQSGRQPMKLNQLLDTKFLEYYLQRHYGSLKCQSNNLNLSIQQKLQQVESQENQGYIVSKLQPCESIMHSSETSNILPSEERAGIKKQAEIVVEKVKLIQIQIPVVVYKLKEVMVSIEGSNVNQHKNDVGSIINQFSRDAEDNFDNQRCSPLNNQETIQKTIVHSSLASMINSNHLKPRETEIELIYSDFPQDNTFKLPLDSFAQIQSLISNQSGSSTGRLSRPPTQRDNLIPINEEIMITEKGPSRSLLQKIQQNQRILNEENLQLKQCISIIQQKMSALEKRNYELQNHNKKLSQRLQEQIKQTQYLQTKLDEINAEILQQKVQCLTHLNEAQERKIQNLMLELNQSTNKISLLTNSLEQLQKVIQLNERQMKEKEEEIQSISRQLQQKQQEMYEIQKCENNVIEIANSSQECLRKEIQKLQSQKSQLQDEIKQYRKRLKIQGINLEYEQAAQIQGIIESREHTYNLRLIDVNRRYEEVVALYQEELSELKVQLKELNQINKKKSELLASKEAKELLVKMKNQQHFKEFQKIIKEYDRQLQDKDKQILSLKVKSSQDEDVQLVLQKFVETINLLQSQLLRERSQKAKITSKFIELDEIVRKEFLTNNKKDIEMEEELIQKLSIQLQRKMNQNQILKKKLEEQSALIFNLIENQGQGPPKDSIINENSKLKSINKKLKNYTLLLEKQIKAVCTFDECQNHRLLINTLLEQKNYFCDLLTQQVTQRKELQASS